MTRAGSRRAGRAELRPGALAQRVLLIPVVIVLSAALVALGLLPLFGATGMAVSRVDREFRFDEDQSVSIPVFPQRSTIYAADGTELATLADENRVEVALEDVSLVARQAVLAIEDDGFYRHGAVDIFGILRAALANLRAGRVVQGGSTITQQLVKNTETGNEQTFARKFREAQDAIRLEQEYSKDEIFQEYLNEVYFGHGTYGIASAAEWYFATSADKLRLPQSALLAGLIASPAKWDPIEHPDAAIARRNEVLGRMLKLRWITSAQYEKATGRPIKLSAKKRNVNALGPEPYFVQYVKNMILHPDEVFPKDDPQRGRIIKLFGKTDDERRRALFQGGLKIYTTVRPDMQREAAEAVERHLPHQGPTPPRDPQSAVVTVVPETGAVQAMYGGLDFSKQQFNLATQGHRTAGSSFKAFTLAAALTQGVPVGKVYDGTSPAHIPLDKCPQLGGEWEPHNAADGEGNGFIDMATATADSINAWFAQLIADVGPANVSEMAKRMGVVSYDRGAGVYVPAVCAITLGAVTVNPLSMTSGYSTLANQGTHCWPFAIRKVVSNKGKVLYRAKPSCQQVIDPKVAAQVTELLEGVVQHGTGTAATLIGRPVAGKTGTGQEYQDAWFMGYVPQLVTGVWVGYSKNLIPMNSLRVLGGSPAFGGTIAAPIWHDYMQKAVAGMPVENFPAPPPGKSGKVPDVIGMKKDQAVKTLAKANFTAVPEDVPCVDPVGIVCTQSPGPGATATLGSAVHIGVSNGQTPKVKVPSVVGKTKEAAIAALDAAGFVAKVEFQPVANPKNDNKVLSQDPGAGAERQAGTTVTIVVGKFEPGPSPPPSPTPTPTPGKGGGPPGRGGWMWVFVSSASLGVSAGIARRRRPRHR